MNSTGCPKLDKSFEGRIWDAEKSCLCKQMKESLEGYMRVDIVILKPVSAGSVKGSKYDVLMKELPMIIC